MSRLLRHPAMTILKNSVSRELLRMVVLASAVLAAGLTTVALTYSTNLPLAVAGLLIMVGGTFLFYNWSRRGLAENAPVIHLLHYDRRRIVWIYTVRTDIMPFGVRLFRRTYLVFKTIDAAEHSVLIPSSKRRVVLHWLGRLLPHATFGFSSEKSKVYSANPAFLLRQGDEGSKNPS